MSTRKECEWPASHVASVVRKQRDREAMLGLLVFSLSFTEGPLSREQIVVPTIRVCPTSFKPPWILPHRYVQKFVSKVILNVIKLATKTKQLQVKGRWKDGSAVERASCFGLRLAPTVHTGKTRMQAHVLTPPPTTETHKA